jgi:hypothetical protein
VHGQNNSFPGLHGVDHLARAITQVADPDLHVRQRSTILVGGGSRGESSPASVD